MDQSDLIYNGEVADRLSHAIVDGGHGLDNVPGLLKKVIKHNLWQERYVGGLKQVVKFKKFGKFVTAKPLEGLGTTRKVLERICEAVKDLEALALLQEAFDDVQGRNIESDNNETPSLLYNDGVSATQGTSAAYLTRRIARDHPEILERMKAGEYPSVRRAAIDAGIIQELTTVEKMQKLWLKMTPEEKEAFQIWATGQL